MLSNAGTNNIFLHKNKRIIEQIQAQIGLEITGTIADTWYGPNAPQTSHKKGV